MQRFLRNDVADEAIERVAQLWADAAASPSPFWLLVDHALLDPSAAEAISRKLQWAAPTAALSNSRLASFGPHGPHLWPIPKADTALLAEALKQWLRPDRSAAALSWLQPKGQGASQVVNLCDALAYLSVATVDQDTSLHCRLADARVLPALQEALDASQRIRLGQYLTQWGRFSAQGALVSWQPAENVQDHPADAKPNLHLTAQQFAHILDASEPDILFEGLKERTPELVPTSELGTFRLTIERVLATAKAYRLTETPDRLQFLVLSLSCGESFHEHPELQATWRSIRDDGARLVQEVEGWSDSIWQAIETKSSNN